MRVSIPDMHLYVLHMKIESFRMTRLKRRVQGVYTRGTCIGNLSTLNVARKGIVTFAANNKGDDQTAQMRRLICNFVVRI